MIFASSAFIRENPRKVFSRARLLIEDISLPLIILLAQPTGLPAGTCL